MNKLNRLSLLGATASVLILAGAGCVGGTTSYPPSPAAPAVPTGVSTPQPTAPSVRAPSPSAVSIVNFLFQSSDLNIGEGETVVWTNNDSAPHTVTADDGSFTSDTIQPGSTYSHIFTQSGVVAYHCAIHPSMHGSVTVTKRVY